MINMPMELPDQKYWRAAVSYIELGMYLDADAELDKIDPLNRAAPDVLAARLAIYRGLEKWELMQVVAKKLAEHDPTDVQWAISRAYATRRSYSIEAARAILLEALKKHPNDPTINYNLACYQTQLGNLDEAKNHLVRATTADAKFRLMALDDKDLEPLWLEIGRLDV